MKRLMNWLIPIIIGLAMWFWPTPDGVSMALGCYLCSHYRRFYPSTIANRRRSHDYGYHCCIDKHS